MLDSITGNFKTS